MLISDNSLVKMNYFDSYFIQNDNSRIFKWTRFRRTSPEVRCLHPTSSRRKMGMPSVSNMIYHKFLRGATSCMADGENVYVMLEFSIFLHKNIYCHPLLELSR